MSTELKENGIQRAMRLLEEQRNLINEQQSELECWRWMAEVRLSVQENSVVGRPSWAVLDVDGEILGQGDSPVEAIRNARSNQT